MLKQRCRPANASTKSDQRLGYPLSVKNESSYASYIKYLKLVFVAELGGVIHVTLPNPKIGLLTTRPIYDSRISPLENSCQAYQNCI